MTRIPKPFPQPGVVMPLRPLEQDPPLANSARNGTRDCSAAVARAMPLSATQREFLARFEASRSTRPAMQDLTNAFTSALDVPRILHKRDDTPFSKTRKQDG